MKIIPVKIRNKLASKPMLVDDWDYEILKVRKWREEISGYAHARFNGKIILAHKIIIWCPKGMQADHIDGNKLNNQKSNLRICTQSQNQSNRNKPKNNTSGFKGVSWGKKSNKWQASIKKNNKDNYLGLFKNKEDAAKIYNKAAKEMFGEISYLNDC